MMTKMMAGKGSAEKAKISQLEEEGKVVLSKVMLEITRLFYDDWPDNAMDLLDQLCKHRSPVLTIASETS